jgi:hypothetical protein
MILGTRRHRGRFRIAGMAAFVLLIHQFSPALAAETAVPLVPLVRGLPWTGVSGLIGYGGRLWFANSVKFVNHNSADLYSYDPASGRAGYEKHLFSQDAGEPLVAGGLLYWPFEDSRFSPGRGEFMVTDGKRWQWHVLAPGRAFHTHTMVAAGGALYAATSAWRARLLRSRDGGDWRLVYQHPTPKGRVSRMTMLADFNGVLYGGLTTWYDDNAPKLLRWTGDTLRPVPGWPAGEAVPEIAVHGGWLYAVNVGAKGRALWRTDGRRIERVTAMDRHPVRALASGAGALWAVGVDGDGGALWRSADGRAWSLVQEFTGVQPLDVAVFGGAVYVGMIAEPGGELWGPAAPRPVPESAAPGRLPPEHAADGPPLKQALAALDAALAAEPPSRAVRRAVLGLARNGAPAAGAALMRRLEGPFPAGEAGMFGGRVRVPGAKLARWYLLWGMAHNGHGRVPPDLLAAPWTPKPNRAEKYLEPVLAAAWAVARLGQNDRATLAALIARLDAPGDPDWLKGDIIGALSDLTGRRFGYDIAAWRRWWRKREGQP